MTLPQIESLGILAITLALFISDRLRYDVVAALALAVAAVLGVVPHDKVFEGFANPVVIIIAAVLVLGRAVTVSGVIEAAVTPVLHRLRFASLQIGALVACVTFLSALMKNVGTLGIFIPIAAQAAARGKRSPSSYMMPMSFGSLIGGTMTLIGTSPNLLISGVRQEVQGRPFAMFDFLPVGLPLSVISIGFLALGWRLLPAGRTEAAAQPDLGRYTSEARIPDGSGSIGKAVGALEAMSEGEIEITAVQRDGARHQPPAADLALAAGDILMLHGDPVAMEPLVERSGLELLHAEQIAQPNGAKGKDSELDTVEAVVTGRSELIGKSPESLALRSTYGLNLLAVSRSRQRITSRIRQTLLRAGDVLVLQGHRASLAEVLARLGCLPLAERQLRLGQERPRWFALIVLAVALGLVAMRLLPADIAFFAAAVAVVLGGALRPREAYEAIDWPIIVMLGCLIPVGESLRDTGAATVIAGALTGVAGHLPGPFAVALVLIVSMLVTPFMHHAAAVLVMGPIAAAIAHALGFAPEAFLMAVALGASSDFLTPIGHQNNLLVMGPGGYRFGDYWKLGLPMSCMVASLGTWLILRAWPLH